MNRANRALALIRQKRAQLKNGLSESIPESESPEFRTSSIQESSTESISNGEETKDNINDWEDWDPMAEDFNSSKNTLALDANKDPISSLTGQVIPISSKIGNVTICEHYAKYGECADGDYCDRIHVNPKIRERIWALQNTYETNKNRICMNFTYLSPQNIEPDSHSLLLVSVTNAASPTSFYFVAPYETMNFANKAQGDLDFFIQRVPKTSSARTKLQKCHEQLASLFEHSYRIDNIKDDIFLSQIVACKLRDGHFRRAMVVETPDECNDKYDFKLLLLDVGIEVELPRELIYDIKAICLSEPPMAVNCRLDVKPPNGLKEWPQKTLDFFQNGARSEQYLLCKILDYITYDKIFTVDLYHPITRQSFTDIILDKGLADKCDY